MEENSKQKVSKKAIIITTVSIIAVLALGITIGAVTRFLMDKNNNKITTSAKVEEKTNEEMEKELEEARKKAEEEEAKRLEEEAKLKEEEEKAKEEEEAKKAEEEKAKAEEEAKKQEENKTEEEKKKKQQATHTNNGYPYYIKVNYSANTVTVYKKDASGNYTVPVKAMICSTGADTSIYNNGTYRTLGKARWGQLIGPVWGQYCTRVFGGVLFHSVPYLKQNDNSTLEYWEYDRLGQNRSLGCIRLTVADAQWLYNNCPVGTTVTFYGSSNPGPLGKPTAPKVTWAGEPYRGWDPTDPDPKNPWHTKAARDAEAAAKAAAEKKAAEEAAAKAAAEKKAAEEAAAKKKAEEEAAAKKQAEEEAKAKEEANKVTVPNVVGKTEAEAKSQLQNLGLKVTINYDEKATKNNGLVSYQSITSSSKVVKGTSITITVNKVKQNTTPQTNTTKPTNTTTNNNNATNTAKPTNTASGNTAGNTTNPKN